MRFLVVVLALTASLYSARASTGATVPWTTYEAEAMSTSGTVLGPQYTNSAAGESSGRKCVQLLTNQYLQFTAQGAANSLIVRYSVPDTTDGVGADYTISLYTNGTFFGKLPVTSKYSWLYGDYPFNNTPTNGSPRNLFDEVRINGLNINPGDTNRLEVDAGDSAAFYDIDLVDLENVTNQISQPGGSYSVTSYSADPTGANDSTTAFKNTITAASGHGNVVWIPPGTFKISQQINLPSNITIQGAGMWYSTLVGDPSLYMYSGNRVCLNGTSNNIHLADFAIIGKLNYRNDNDPNDGLGGSYGTGSTISRIWVEHTKVGAWIVNSKGLVIDSCRFRDTIADGCNIDEGMQSTIVTNCTTRGTGDDCFAIWPATYLTTESYAPGFNVFTHCTGQNNFLANGCSIDGGASNTVQDCYFQDIAYGCGILVTTEFSVVGNGHDNSFSGVTTAQRCNLNRCGGYDIEYGWRAAVQLDMYKTNITGIDLDTLNITNSTSDGLSVIAPFGNPLTNEGILSNALAANITILNYGTGVSGRNALWARSDASGSLTVSNSTIIQFRNDSSSFTFNFVTGSVNATVNTSPTGMNYSVDGTNYSSPQVFTWTPGSNHNLATTATQSGGTGVQYVWNSWSDGGALSHTVAPNSSAAYTANFTTQYYLTLNAGTGGGVGPGSLWTNSAASVHITATPSTGYGFTGWTGSGTGSYTGTNNPATVTLNGPVTETANFTQSNTPPVQSMTFVQQPANALPGAVITPEVQVKATGTNGQVLAGAAIMIALGSGTGVLAGTLTRNTDAGGLAHFNDLSVNLPGLKTLTATAAIGSAPPTNSNPFAIIGPAAALVFADSPDSAVVGVPFAQQPVLQIVDQFGTPSTIGLPASLPGQIALTNGNGTLLGATGFDIGTNAGDGFVEFANLAISAPGTNVQLVASTSSATGNPVAGAVLWLDAADSTTLTTNGTKVQAWKNKGTAGAGSTGTNLWFTQYTNSLQPWLTNQINGLPVVTFNKNGHGFNAGCTFLGNIGGLSYTNGGSQMTYFLVASKWENANGWQAPVSFSTNAQIDGKGTAGVAVLVDGSTSAPYPLGIQRNHAALPMQADIPAPPVNTAFLLTFLDNAGAATLSLADAVGDSETNTASIVNGISPYTYGITDVTIGGRLEPDPTNIDNGWDGDVAEVLVYNTALNASDQATTQNYLKSKWLGAGGSSYLNGALSASFNVQAGTPPQQNILAIVNVAGTVTVTYATSPGYQYHLEYATNLAPTAWSSISSSFTNPTGGTVIFTDPNPLLAGERFYRTVSP